MEDPYAWVGLLKRYDAVGIENHRARYKAMVELKTEFICIIKWFINNTEHRTVFHFRGKRWQQRERDTKHIQVVPYSSVFLEEVILWSLRASMLHLSNSIDIYAMSKHQLTNTIAYYRTLPRRMEAL